MRQRLMRFHGARAPSNLPDVVLLLGGTNDLSQAGVASRVKKSFRLFGAQMQVPVAVTISNMKACISKSQSVVPPNLHRVEIRLQAMHELAASWGAVVGVLSLPRFVNPKVPDAPAEFRFQIHMLAGGFGQKALRGERCPGRA